MRKTKLNKKIFGEFMDLSDYQKFTATTAIYPDRGGILGLVYLQSLLGSEAGEVLDKIGKCLRDKGLEALKAKFGTGDWGELKKELGDVAWALSELCTHFGFTLDDVLECNKKKLIDRQQRVTIKGSGDDR